ncbi:MAG: DUF4097 family beta strand repeat-containing protein, partial [Actinomycetota bacterium]|nr:DUF4097 family beta strand repeat-containing protein [Actinomycetota bacterium]
MPTFQTPNPISANIEVGMGDITITASDRFDTVVLVHPRDESRPADVQAARDATVEYAGSALTVRAVKTWRRFTSKNDGALIVEIQLPSGSSLKAVTGMGAVHCEGQLTGTEIRTGMGEVRIDHVGSLIVKSGMGDVFADHIVGDAKVSTGTGVIRLGRIKGSAVIRNSNGPIDLGVLEQGAHIRTASGDVAIGQSYGSLTAGSAAGSIRIAELSAGSANIRTAAGSVDIGIREGTAAWLDVLAHYGLVRNSLESASQPGNA